MLASAIFEFPTMYKENAFEIVRSNPIPFIIAASMGVGVNFLSYLVIQYTSSLTMKILGTARNVVTIFIGVLFYGEVGIS